MGIPAFPAAHLLVFWGGVQQGFWAFGNNSIDYASRVDLPVLLMYGDQDQRVQVSEMLVIQDELKGLHHLAVFKGLAHQSYYKAQPENWMKVVQDFLNSLPDPAVGGGSGIR